MDIVVEIKVAHRFHAVVLPLLMEIAAAVECEGKSRGCVDEGEE